MVTSAFISIGGNCQPHASDWSPKQNLVTFGASQLVCIWDPSSTIRATMKGHTDSVTATKFIKDEFVISGSLDSSLRLWNLKTESCEQTLTDHTKSITFISTYRDDDYNLVATGSVDGAVILWIFDEQTQQLRSVSRIEPKKGFYPLCGALKRLQDSIVLAVGGTSNDIYVYSSTVPSGNETTMTLDARLAGHENWVRSMSFKDMPGGDMLLASAGQDRYIRLWRVHKGTEDSIGERTTTFADTDYSDEKLLSNKVYEVARGTFCITFEALLMGHDDWIFTISWHPSKVELLSASADTTLMFWSPDESSGVWLCSSRLGDVSIKGASTATGASGGFWSSLWLDGGNKVATVGKTGSWRVWSRQSDSGEWIAQLGISGHVREVTDVAWEVDTGRYLLSTSLDQTTRLFSTWKKDSQWHEISRPQIHGYDMVTVKSLSPEVFVSGGDEKTLRVFEQPKGIAYLLNSICGTSIGDVDTLPESAIVPALGLSNKQEEIKDETPADADEDEDELPSQSIRSVLSSLDEPPKEEHLQRQTLWPELEKLYGHGYEVSSIDISHDRKILATCCKANTETHAVVRLYDTTTWLQLPDPLAFHNLTITRLRFSPNGKCLLTVSRDRQWALWERSDDGTFSLAASNPKGHSRIIWDCCWLPDGTGFVTASRDKSIKLWKQSGESWQEVSKITLAVPVTAVDMNERGVLVAGLEDGSLYVYRLSGEKIELVEQVNEHLNPWRRINRISLRPGQDQFAVASDDFSLRLYDL